MQHELHRLASFGEYQQDRRDLSCLTLARKGYFNDGRLPACFQCRKPLPRDENITAENLDEVHRRTSVNCSPLETINVPLTKPTSPVTESDGNLPEEPISAVYRRAWTRAESRGIFASGSQPGRRNLDEGQLPGRENLDQGQFHGRENLDEGQFPGRENPDEGERFRDEAARLRSFRGWPPGAPVQPEALAAAGFFYTGTGDRVCCAFCEGVLSGWERGDDPTKEHDRHYGDRNCPFRRHQRRDRHDGHCHGSGPEVYCNDQLRSGLPMTTTPRERTISWSEQTTVSRNESPSRTLNLLTNEQSRQVPRHPEFADQLQRFRTYPLAALQTGQRAESLARAGFFYEGPEDRVRCFHCAGLLKNWKPAELPLDEHEKWFPGCQFLQSLRNDVSLQDTSRQMQSAAFSVGLTAEHFSSASGYPVESREIKARMDSASVVALLQMGFSRTLIRQAIEIRLRTIGDEFPSAESLLEAVFELQEKMSLEEASARPRDHGNGEPTGRLTSSATPYVIVAADKKELVQPAASLNQLANQMAQTSEASASNKSSRDTPASEAVSSIDASNSQPPKQKNKTRKRQKKCSQKKTPDNLKTTESNEEVKTNDVECSMDTGEGDPTGLDEV